MAKESAGIMLVTGGSRGIGAAISKLAAQKGYDVCINYARNEARAREVARAVEEAGARAMIYRADVSQEEHVIEMFRAVDATLGRLTVLINNAGITGPVSRVEDITTEILDQVFNLNVRGTFLCSREALRRMSTRHGGQGGSIINLSSAAARLGAAGRNIHYASSKGAINTFTFGLAQEVATEGVRVNAISPGMIDTEIQDQHRLANMLDLLPMKRAGTAEEVAHAALWLASAEASYVSGTVLGVSGAR